MSAKERGHFFEAKALQYLQQQGLTLIIQNFSCRFGEIDLILSEKKILVFVEVRFRGKASHGNALESINAHKQSKIRKTAQYFLLTHRQYHGHACRFDALAMDDKQ